MPVTSGAKDPPTFPPKFWSDTSEETMCGGATSIGMEFTAAVEKLALATNRVSSAIASTSIGADSISSGQHSVKPLFEIVERTEQVRGRLQQVPDGGVELCFAHRPGIVDTHDALPIQQDERWC